jgi:hypothetical protein
VNTGAARPSSVRLRSPTRVLVVATAIGALSGCVTDHELLSDKGGTGGRANGGRGALGDGGGSADGATPTEGSGGTVPDTKPGDDEPPGPRHLTLLHGVIDSPWIGFCFARMQGNAEDAPSGAPVPKGGLDYGRSAVLDTVPGLDLASDGIHPYLVAAASARVVAGLGCAEILARAAARPHDDTPAPDAAIDAHAAGFDATTYLDAFAPAPGFDAEPPRDAAVEPAPDAAVLDARPPAPPPIPDVRVASLPILAAGSFVRERSYLLAAGGCVGGASITDPSEKSVCGEQYAPDTPTLSEMVVQLSRAVRANRVGLQYLGGTPAVRVSDLTLIPGVGGDPADIVAGVSTGSIRPVPPNTDYDSADIGPSASRAAIELFADGSTVYAEPWRATLEAGGLTTLENGKAYTLVVVGPYPGFAKRNWWNDPLVTIVEN